jgi:hypothetical protein
MYKIVKIEFFYSPKFAIIKRVNLLKWRFILNNGDRIFLLSTRYAAEVYINQIKKSKK